MSYNKILNYKYTLPDNTVLDLDLLNFTVFNDVSFNELLRFFKTRFSNFERFNDRVLKNMMKKPNLKMIQKSFDYWIENWDNVEKYSFEDAFLLKNTQYQRLVFSSIDIESMIKACDGKPIKSETKPMVRKCWDKHGNELPSIEYINKYTVWEANGRKLGGRGTVYAVECECTTTSKKAFLWIAEEFKSSPASAIASTFHIHENVIEVMTALKRQGDTMYVETSEWVKPEGPMRPLTADEYFNFLVSES